MSFLAILLALLIDRLLLEDESYRRHRWIDGYHGRLSPYLPAAPWAPLLLLLPPLLAVALLQSLLDHGLAALAFSGALLILTLGPRDLDREVNPLIDELESGACGPDEVLARLGGRQPQQGETPRPSRVAEAILSQANGRLFSVLFWFILLGPLGTALYRLSRCLHDVLRQARQHEGQYMFERLIYLLEWLPARLTALTYAISGSFEDAMRNWRRRAGGPLAAQNDEILAAAGMGALFQDEALHEEQLPPPATQAEAALGMVWRALLVWLGLLAFTLLAQWLG
ncbi:MAG: regulatory signaling modulator protein AmpE [Candidatus Sedimenticola endophacoides]|uniref:Regulatory signaling modulator protein AmpE n=1 Tax=Candidatus Sedimenticola endophacoides TaxID=2548426 RepID=A0A657PUB0_9GAMM|nr:MAG: hypothetical protein B0D94_07020 [Candidatus Sedimenticola endophacoides]OQX35874.1 MAG: hypothetical protein B0D96_05840 [Candidatus Sedimenticola endophacoides]OQX37025.1 MAG: hypothetical protein B0D84_00950 [Candidatus Sedimenticola endophacoides]OQX41054.1 MAG: hypothetical protein B0D89_05530 [Candidatus Sedimenticola endophacoides]OQX41161.1 MAG: hypothetical protein B0D88_08010 [Candidatus Sedimenticola endophacoides]